MSLGLALGAGGVSRPTAATAATAQEEASGSVTAACVDGEDGTGTRRGERSQSQGGHCCSLRLSVVSKHRERVKSGTCGVLVCLHRTSHVFAVTVGGRERPLCRFWVILLHQNFFFFFFLPGKIETEVQSQPEATE